MSKQEYRDELERVLFDQLGVTITQMTHGTPKVIMDTRAVADAILLSPVIRRIQAEALRGFRRRLIEDQIHTYAIVLPDVNGVVDDLNTEADRIEQGGDNV